MSWEKIDDPRPAWLCITMTPWKNKKIEFEPVRPDNHYKVFTEKNFYLPYRLNYNFKIKDNDGCIQALKIEIDSGAVFYFPSISYFMDMTGIPYNSISAAIKRKRKYKGILFTLVSEIEYNSATEGLPKAEPIQQRRR